MAFAAVVPALLAGCMRMQTQQQTLEHRPQVVRPDADSGDHVAEVPEQDGASR